MRSIALLIAFAASLAVLSARAEEAAPAPATAVGTTTAEAPAAEAKPSRFSAAAEYMATTDLADELEPRVFEHSLEATLGYDLGKGFSVFGVGTLYYQSVGRSILVEDSENPIYWEALFGVAKKFELGRALGAEHGLKLTAKNSLPVSDDNRYEAVRSIPGAGVALSSAFFDSRVTLVNSLSYHYIVHTYYFSPVSGNVNTRDGTFYLGSVAVNIWGGLSGTVGTGVKLSRKVDGSNDYAYNNFQTLAYSFGELGLSVTHENGGFTREGDVSLWYVDQYRRIVSGSVSYSF